MANEEFGISKSTASRYMAINDRFSEGENSPNIAAKYKDFGRSQLQEMLYLDAEQLEKVTPESQVREIRELRVKKPELVEIQIPGQLEITDFPELIPESYQDPQEAACSGLKKEHDTYELCIEDMLEFVQSETVEAPAADQELEGIARSQQVASLCQQKRVEASEQGTEEDFYDAEILDCMIDTVRKKLKGMKTEPSWSYKESSMALEALEMYRLMHAGKSRGAGMFEMTLYITPEADTERLIVISALSRDLCELKGRINELILRAVREHDAPAGTYHVEMVITADGEYYDSDEIEVAVDKELKDYIIAK